MNNVHRPHGANLRKGRVSEIGRVYLVTFVVRGRRPVFQDFHLGRLIVAELRAADLVQRIGDYPLWDAIWL